jgi:DNA-binding NarL/FixJ family response regulator
MNAPAVRVILADDHTLVRAGIRRIIESQPGCVVVGEAADGHEAVLRTRALLPHVVLMDLSLPGKDGWQATRELKADPATRHIPVIALTGHAHGAAAAAAAAAGCDAFLMKPCLPDVLVAQVKARLAAR